MTLLPLAELERRCQKPDHRRIGNWMARRISRPMALHITRIVLPTGISAHWMTLVAWSCGVGAAASFGWGSATGWLLGAGLLQLWYLLDHVDGQLARYHGTASLDGVQLDYLMHHTINLLVPLGVGTGLASATIEPLWSLAGLLWGVSNLLTNIQHDARYKAVVQRLKRVQGTLQVTGGGGARPTPTNLPPLRPTALLAWSARKACEAHVVMNLLTVLAALWLLAPTLALLASQTYLALTTLLSTTLTTITLTRSLRHHSAEHEFAAWYQPPPGHYLVFDSGWWLVEPEQGYVHPSPNTAQAVPGVVKLNDLGRNAWPRKLESATRTPPFGSE